MYIDGDWEDVPRAMDNDTWNDIDFLMNHLSGMGCKVKKVEAFLLSNVNGYYFKVCVTGTGDAMDKLLARLPGRDGDCYQVIPLDDDAKAMLDTKINDLRKAKELREKAERAKREAEKAAEDEAQLKRLTKLTGRNVSKTEDGGYIFE
ncbi:MAG: hypothetical protein F4Y90_03075 [Rhodothermaceae bacterium]|nr:hypothetical protein [Rhodothermaceae bacterium]